MLHEYLRDTLGLSYNEYKSCRNRTQFTCIECRFCYSCHWRNEKLEKKIQFKPLAITKSTFLKNYSQPVTATLAKIEEIEEHSLRQPTQQQQLTKVIDVFGRETEPICSYHTCHHKFSLHRHSTRTCKCHHPGIIFLEYPYYDERLENPQSRNEEEIDRERSVVRS